MWFIIGLILGWFVGLISAVCAQLRVEREATKQGVVKLNNRYYKITKLDE